VCSIATPPTTLLSGCIVLQPDMPTSCACCCRVGRLLGGAGHVGSSWAGTTTADTASGATTVSDSAAIGGWHVLLSHCSSAIFCGCCIFAALLPDLKPMAASTLHDVPLHDAQRSSLRGYASVPVASPRGSDRNLAAVDDSPPPFGSIHNVTTRLSVPFRFSAHSHNRCGCIVVADTTTCLQAYGRQSLGSSARRSDSHGDGARRRRAAHQALDRTLDQQV
jgi:hypothetical protein